VAAYVYILQCSDGRYYYGSTGDLSHRERGMSGRSADMLAKKRACQPPGAPAPQLSRV